MNGIIDTQKFSENEKNKVKKFFENYKKYPDEFEWQYQIHGNKIPLVIFKMLFGGDLFLDNCEEK